MNKHFSLRIFLLAGLLACGIAPVAQAQSAASPKASPTVVYLVRHAEKDTTSNPADPALSAVGQVRAQALRQVLINRHPTALFTTDTKRTRATLAPLAEATKLTPLVYDAKLPAVLVARIRQEYQGQTVVIVGHSNTLLPLIESLGGTLPVDVIGDNEYDYLFTVRLVDGALPTATVRGYGPERRPSGATKAEPAP